MAEKTPESSRIGPRPLLLHWATALAVWQSSKLALPFLRHSWQAEVPGLTPLARLSTELTEAPLDALNRALDREIAKRSQAFARGLERYRSHPHRRRTGRAQVLWQEGTTRLLDYAPEGGLPILLVPSLINRAYVLDLDDGISFCRWLCTHGFRPFLVDWDAPAEEERGFTLTDYIAGRLSQALDRVRTVTEAPPLILGYCLGGMLALGLAHLRSDDLAGLVLLATPWDFHAGMAVSPAQMRLAALCASTCIDSLGVLPVDGVQTLFYALDPWSAVRKFSTFGQRPLGGDKERAFVALEDWLNDGVALAGPVAREVLVGWYAENRPSRGLWRLAGQPVRPGAMPLPCLAVIPSGDRIVPSASAEAIVSLLPDAQVLRPPAGHVGMLVGSNAAGSVWIPIAAWAKML